MGTGQISTDQEAKRLAQLPNMVLAGTVRSDAEFARTTESFLSR